MPSNVGSLKRKWAVGIPNGIQGAAPLEVRGMTYAQSTDGTVYAVHSRTGTIAWTYASGYRLGITAGDKAIYTGCQLDSSNRQFGICALDAATGAVKWKTPIPDCGGGQAPFSSAPDNVPVYDNGRVIFGANYGGFNSACSGDAVHAVNATTGALLWAVAENAEDKSDALPFAVDQGTVFYPTGGASITICALNETSGAAKGCSAPLSPSFADSATLSVSGGKILSVYEDNSGNTIFGAFDETTLALVWKQSASGGTSNYSRYAPTVANGLAYFYAGTNGNGSLFAFSLKTGAPVWSYACNGGACLDSGVSAANGVLYASCDEGPTPQGDQCAFDAKTGALLRQFGSTDGHDGTESTPLVANGAVIGACDGYGGSLCKFAP